MHSSTPRLVGATLVALAALIGWALAGLDLEAARLAGNAAGFPLRDHWLASGVLHTSARYLAWLFVLALCIVVVWPVGDANVQVGAVPRRRRYGRRWCAWRSFGAALRHKQRSGLW